MKFQLLSIKYFKLSYKLIMVKFIFYANKYNKQDIKQRLDCIKILCNFSPSDRNGFREKLLEELLLQSFK